MRKLLLAVLNKLYVCKCTLRAVLLRKCLGLSIHPTVRIASHAKFDKVYPQGIHIDEYTHIGSGTVVLAHDFVRALYAHTYIGKHCFIGINSTILPGVRIGDHVIIGAGSIVTKEIPSGSVAAGNPARIISTHGKLEKFGKLPLSERNKRKSSK